MEITIESKKLGVKATIKSLLQRDLEKFGAALAEEGVLSSGSQRRGANVRAAIQAGWFTEIEPSLSVEQVADQLPAVIVFLGTWIDLVYREVTTVPPD